jgi:hypothetical protein
MKFLFPFCSLNDNQLLNELQCVDCKPTIINRLSDHGLKDFIFNLSKNEYFKSLDSSYYTIDQFNQKVKRYGNNIELSVLHLNIRSLNSKISEFCILIDLLETDLDVIVLSEIWCNNIDFYSNVLAGYDFYKDLPESTKVGGLGVFVKKTLGVRLRNDLKLSSSAENKIENI